MDSEVQAGRVGPVAECSQPVVVPSHRRGTRGTRSPERSKSRHHHRLHNSRNQPLVRRLSLLAGAVFVIFILVNPTYLNPTQPKSAQSNISPDQSGAGSPTTFYPYISPPTSFDTAQPLPGQTESESFPQLVSFNFENTSAQGLAVVETDYLGNSYLAFETGFYSPAIANSSAFVHPSCSAECTEPIPINWGSPVIVASFGTQKITADSAAANGTKVAVAVAVLSGGSATTEVFASYDFGVNNSWVSVTSSESVTGGSPQLTMTPCGILLTTITTAHLVVTTFPFNCHAYPSSSSSSTEDVRPLVTPAITSVYPNWGSVGKQVTVTGNGFSNSGLNVYFESSSNQWAGGSIKYLSSTVILVNAPSGPPSGSTVDIVVTDNGGTSGKSAGDEFFYSPPPIPMVTSVSPSSGSIGVLVNITGAAFLNGSQVVFGSVESPLVVFDTADEIQAEAPYQNPSSYVDVRVLTVGGESARVTSDRYTYTNGTAPGVSSIWPTEGPAGTRIQINGTYFLSTATVQVGGVSASEVQFISSTELTALVPSGAGSQNVIVNSSGFSSGPSSADLFSYPQQLPGSFNRTTINLPAAYDASPVWSMTAGGTNGTLGVFATLVGDSDFAAFVSTSEWGSYNETVIAPFNLTSGSEYFTSVGQTTLQTPGGMAGLVSAVTEGPYFIAFYTDQEQNRTAVRSVSSSNEGATFGTTYLSSPQSGSVYSIESSASPAGYAFLAGLDTGNGSSEVEQSTYSVSGRPLAGFQAFPVLGNGPEAVPRSVSVTVDSLNRPLYVWSQLNTTTNESEAYLDGDYLSALGAVTELKTTFDLASSADFAPIPSQTITNYRSQIDANLTVVETDLEASETCAAERTLATDIYPRLNLAPAHPIFQVQQGCSSSIGSGHSYLAAFTGALNANMTLGVLGQSALEALGFGLFPSPAWLGTPMSGLFSTNETFGGTNVQVGTTGIGVNPKLGDSVLVTPQEINPNSVFLNVSASIQQGYSIDLRHPCSLLGHPVSESTTGWTGTYNYTQIFDYYETVGPSSTTNKTFYWGSALPPGFYLTNLSSSGNPTGPWSFYMTAYYEQFDSTYSCGSSTPVVHSVPLTIGPYSVTLHTSGTYAIGLGTEPASPIVHWRVGVESLQSVYLVNSTWNNTMYANGTATLKVPSNPHQVKSLGRPALEDSESYQAQGTKHGTLVLFVNLTSESGGRNSSWTPIWNTGQQLAASSPLTSYSTCTFSIGNSLPATITLPTIYATNITSTDATLKWFANSNGTGWVQYHEAYGPTFQQTSWEKFNSTKNLYEFQVELHGLTPWGLYFVQFGVSVQDGTSSCAYFDAVTSGLFNTTNLPVIHTLTAPYDSITQTGGNERVFFDVPSNVVTYGTEFSVFAQDYNVSLPTNITSLSLTQGNFSYSGGVIAFNLTVLQPNTVYALSLDFNYTYGGLQFTARNSTYEFYYLKDTSGDGLSDAEKVQGWEVSYSLLNGTDVNRIDSANPLKYATNGLVSDYVEKQFGLNPDTLDTAGSHMLDTWNLTFDLGPNGILPNGSLFHYYYENSTYNYSTACQTFADSSAGCQTTNHGLFLRSNLSAVNSVTAGDSKAWAATARWSGTGTNSALSQLETMMQDDGVSWLRATTGQWGLDRTITVWGKLSWGANSLAQSTSKDGLLDGNQPDPLEPELVKVDVSSWWADLNSANDEGAPFLELSTGPSGSGTVLYQGFGPSEGDAGHSNVSFTGPYVISVPVVQSAQYVYLNLTLDDAESGGMHYPLEIPSVEVDLVGNSTDPFDHSQRNASVTAAYQIIRAGEKAPTFLVTPGNNTTLSNLPWGLKRYTAEPDFDLIVLNLTANTTVAGIGGAEGGYSYSVTLTAGLNNILVPRDTFLTSPLGQALINNTNETVRIPSWSGLSFQATDWSSRSEQSAANTPSNPNYIWVFSTVNQSENGSKSTVYGGLPQNAAVEQGLESRQVQGVFWINVTASGNGLFSSEAQEIDNFLGGLLLNSSGNLTGNLIDVTPVLGSLGLPSTVLSALSNWTATNGGAYATPQYHEPPPSPSWWQSAGMAVWNTVSGIAEATGLTAIISVVWNGLQAAAAYIGAAASWLSSHLGLGRLVSQLAGALKTIANAMLAALDAMLAFLAVIVRALFTPIINAINYLVSSYGKTLTSDFQTLWSELNQTGSETSAASLAFYDTLFGTPMLIAFAIGAAVAVALVVIQAFTLGGGFVLDELATVIGTSLVSALLVNVMNFIPSNLFSTGAISLGWGLLNATGGGLHSLLSGNTSHVVFGVLLPALGVSITTWQAGNDLQAMLAAYKSAGSLIHGGPLTVGFYSALSFSFDLIGLLLSILAEVWHNWAAAIIDGIALIASALGFAIGVLIMALPTWRATAQVSGLWNMVITGSVLGGVSTALSAGQFSYDEGWI
jgi:hypothetical protein